MGLTIAAETSGGEIILRDGLSASASSMARFIVQSGGSFATINFPEPGLQMETGTYATLTTVDGVTVWYK
jgi:C4-type Zn-finger protein